MNYIITTSLDATSDLLVNWLRYYDMPHVRINTDSITSLQAITNMELDISGTKNTGMVYLRKPGMPEVSCSTNAEAAVTGSLKTELYQAYLKLLNSQASLPVNNYRTATQLNKYETLLAAKNTGLQVPETIITNTKQGLTGFMDRHGYHTVITKPAGELCSYTADGYIYKTFTKKLEPVEIQSLPERFFPSLFQQYVSNLLDIKAVYCFGHFYTAAFLQSGTAHTDFRSNYAQVKTLPYKLPDALERKLDKLLQRLELSVCTVDFILSDEGQLYFLEINPFGQFGAISASCNYYIEKMLAQKFIPHAS